MVQGFILLFLDRFRYKAKSIQLTCFLDQILAIRLRAYFYTLKINLLSLSG